MVGQVIQGLGSIYSGIAGHKDRKAEQAAAQAEYDANRARFMNQDLSNPYANMENPYEDFTVNTQAADMMAQQQAVGMASTMNAMKGAAGGSGIAAMAQALAGQQAQNAQAASADIAKQEASNQAAAAQMEGKLQTMERKGDLLSRQMKQEQYSTELGMSQARLGAANLARQQATQAIFNGVGNLAEAYVSTTPGLMDPSNLGRAGLGAKG